MKKLILILLFLSITNVNSFASAKKDCNPLKKEIKSYFKILSVFRNKISNRDIEFTENILKEKMERDIEVKNVIEDAYMENLCRLSNVGSVEYDENGFNNLRRSGLRLGLEAVDGTSHQNEKGCNIF